MMCRIHHDLARPCNRNPNALGRLAWEEEARGGGGEARGGGGEARRRRGEGEAKASEEEEARGDVLCWWGDGSPRAVTAAAAYTDGIE